MLQEVPAGQQPEIFFGEQGKDKPEKAGKVQREGRGMKGIKNAKNPRNLFGEKKLEKIYIRLTGAQKARLKTLARKDRRSLNNYIENIVTRHIEWIGKKDNAKEFTS